MFSSVSSPRVIAEETVLCLRINQDKGLQNPCSKSVSIAVIWFFTATKLIMTIFVFIQDFESSTIVHEFNRVTSYAD